MMKLRRNKKYWNRMKNKRREKPNNKNRRYQKRIRMAMWINRNNRNNKRRKIKANKMEMMISRTTTKTLKMMMTD